MAKVARRSIWLATVFAVVAVLWFLFSEHGLASVRNRDQDPQRESVAVRQRREQAWVAGGLRAAAAITGTFTRSEQVRVLGAPVSFEELGALSQFIAIAVVRSNKCVLSSDGRSVNTEFTLDVQESLKGQAPSSTIQMSLLGGRADFGNGMWAQVNAHGLVHPTNGQRLLVFLRHQPESPGNTAAGILFEPTSGPLGIYALSDMHSPFVIPSGAFGSALARDVIAGHYGVPDFIDTIRRSIRQ